MGSISRLAGLIEAAGPAPDQVRELLKPMRDVRHDRQGPAHTLSRNLSDRTLIHQQVELLWRVNEMLIEIRRFWQSHPLNREWSEPDDMANVVDYRM